MELSKRKEVLLEIEILQNELYQMLEEQDYNTQEVIEKSRSLDKLIIAFYNLSRIEK